MNIVEETITNDDGVEQTYYIFNSKVFSTEEDALRFKEEYEIAYAAALAIHAKENQ